MIIGKNVHKMILTNLTFPSPQSISFYGMLPDDINESHSTNFEPLDIKSRSSQLFSYAGSNSRGVSFGIDVNEDYLAEFNGGRADIREYMAAIKAITYPIYQGTMVIPPSVLLRCGEFLKIRGFCNSCEISWHKPIRDGHYVNATVNISITETLSKSFAANEIFTMEDLRSV